MGLFSKKKRGPLGGLQRIGLDIADDLGMKQPGAGMSDPVHGSMHVVGCSALDAREMRAPCHMTYVIQADGMEAFSGEQVFELWAAQWPEPGDDLPVIFDRADPSHVDVDTTQIPNHADQAMTDAQQLAAQLNAGGAAAGAGVAAGAGGAAGTGGAAGAGGPAGILGAQFAGAQAGSITPIVIGNADPERVKAAMAKAEQALGIDLDGDGVVGGVTNPPAATPIPGAPAPTAPASTGAPAPTGGTIAALEQLAALHDRGALTDEEFAAQKQKLLAG
jgi:hypothetical protein